MRSALKYQALNGWTKETILLAIAKGNLGVRSIADSRCAYRGGGGNKCAVGVFIPDEVYSKDCECQTIDYLLEQYPGLHSYMPLEVDALLSLQAIHDHAVVGSKELDPRPVLLDWVKKNVV